MSDRSTHTPEGVWHHAQSGRFAILSIELWWRYRSGTRGSARPHAIADRWPWDLPERSTHVTTGGA
jgi:hypothetical protein